MRPATTGYLVMLSICLLASATLASAEQPSPSASFFPGFESFQIETSTGITINGVVGGAGPPLLLLHGAPVNIAGWRKVAPGLAEHFTVVVTDLRGYGDSDMPEGGDGHADYSKRIMAQDQVDVMVALGYEQFHVVGHDRGGRVAHRLARDHESRVLTVTVMDILPTLHLYSNVDRSFAEAYWFWFFLSAPAPVPETMIAANPGFFMNASFFGKRELIEDAAFENFVRTMSREGAARAQCEDYRAAASIDLEHDRADLADKLSMPLLVLWGEDNALNQTVDVLELWRERASDVRGRGLAAGHWLPEEVPDELVEDVTAFIQASSQPAR